MVLDGNNPLDLEWLGQKRDNKDVRKCKDSFFLYNVGIIRTF